MERTSNYQLESIEWFWALTDDIEACNDLSPLVSPGLQDSKVEIKPRARDIFILAHDRLLRWSNTC